MSKAKQLLVGVGGIFVCYIFYGLLQEKIFKNQYLAKDQVLKARFTYSSMLAVLQFFLGTTISFLLSYKQEIRGSLRQRVLLGVLNGTSFMCSNKALVYVSYPLQALTKSCKVMSVILASLVNPNSKSLSSSKIYVGLLFTSGVLIFNYFDSRKKEDKISSLLGIGLLVGSILSDGILAQTQSVYKKTYKPSSMMLYFHHNLWSFVFSAAVATLLGQLIPFFSFIFSYEEVLWDVAISSLLGCLGQFFIFYVVNNFEPHVLPMITSSRKMSTVLFSIVMFSHPVNLYQLAGIVIVASVVIYETFVAKEAKHKQ